MLPITATYVAYIALLMAALGIIASMGRGQHNVALGHGETSALELSLRRFGNLAEWGPIALLVLALLEANGTAANWLHLYGATLIVLRLAHPFMLFADMGAPMWKKMGRFITAAGTAVLVIVGALVLLF